MQKLKIKQYINILIVAVLSTGAGSCLKETSHPPLYGWDTPNVISFQDNGGPDGSGAGYGSTTTPYPSYNFSFKLQNDTAGFDAIVVYGPKGPASEDITVNVEANAAALDSFNSANSTSYVMPDASVYSFPSSVVIKKGESQAYVHITIKASPAFDFNASYALALTITSSSSSTVSPNMGSEINIFSVQNIYDGEYTVTGGFVDNTGSFTDEGVYPVDAFLETSGGNSVVFYDNGNSISGKAINAGGSLSYFGAFVPVFTIDPTTGDVTNVADAVPLTDASNVHGRYAQLDPSGVNKYDFSTKTMKVKYIMYQNDIAPGYARVVFDETYTYVGPR